MEDIYQRTIERNLGKLIAATNINTLLPVLLEKKVFDSQFFKKEVIELCTDCDESEEMRKRRMFSALERSRTKEWFDFLEALRETGHQSVRELIERECTKTIVTDAPMKIVVKPSRRFCQFFGNPPIPVYRTCSKRRGLLLLINNVNFVDECEPRRTGAYFDEMNVAELFGQMGFGVCMYRDLGVAPMRKVICDFASTRNERLRGLESIFVIVMSHGYGTASQSESWVVASDGLLLNTSWIVNQFSVEKCPTMAGRPKVILFQACPGMITPEVSQRLDAEERQYQMSTDTLTDILVGYCQNPGCQTSRDPETDGWYIRIICNVFMNHAHDTHVEDLLRIVEYKMASLKTSTGTTPITKFQNLKFNKFFLHPRLYARRAVVAPAPAATSASSGVIAGPSRPQQS